MRLLCWTATWIAKPALTSQLRGVQRHGERLRFLSSKTAKRLS
jgi:hypothetical protein